MWGINTDHACLEQLDFSASSLILRAIIAKRRAQIPDVRYQNSLEDELDDSMAPVQEVMMIARYLDRSGQIQQATTRTSQGPNAFHEDAKLVRQAIKAYYDTLGCELMGIEMSVESSVMLQGTRQRPQLRVVGSDRRSAVEIDIRL